jgi:hypothetical protein
MEVCLLLGAAAAPAAASVPGDAVATTTASFGVSSLGGAAGADVDVAGSPSVGLSQTATAAAADAADVAVFASAAGISVLSRFEDRRFDLISNVRASNYIVEQQMEQQSIVTVAPCQYN